MTLAEFRIIIEKIGTHTNTLMFYFMGEPFLNRDAYQMILVAKEAGIPWVTTCTNGDIVDPEQLVMSKINLVSFQIGGMSQETHRIYRVNSLLERVLSNLKECLRLRRERNIPIVIETGFILMKHNEHELKEYLRYMSDLGVDCASVIDPCVRTVEQAYKMLPTDKKRWIYDPLALAQGVLKPRASPKNMCPWIYYSMVILASGDVVPCCRDVTGRFVMGNLLTQSLDEIWNGERFKKFRRMLFTDQSSSSICNLCSGYPASRING
jgi:radical SAM protein with 4Fe4S-binding SPASM domain